MRLRFTVSLVSIFCLLFAAALPAAAAAKKSGVYSGARSVLLDVSACASKDKAMALFKERALAKAEEWDDLASEALALRGAYRFVWEAGGVRLVQETGAPGGKAGERCIHGVAEVPYFLDPLDGEGDPALLAKPDAPLTVGLVTDKGSYGKDDSIQAGFIANKDFYGRLFFVSANGAVIQLVPALAKPAPLFKGGVQYDFPSEDGSVELKVTKPYGTGRMLLFASTAPMAELPLKQAGGGLGMYVGSTKELEAAVRRLADPAKAPCEFFRAEWTFSTGSALPITSRAMRRKKPLKPIEMFGAAGRSARPGTEGLK